MFRMSTAAFVIAVLGSHVALNAQTRPDYSGTWEPVPNSSGASSPERPVFGQRFTIDHQGQSLTLHRIFAAGPATIKYTLDGAETASRMPGSVCQPDSGAVWTAVWDDDAVVLTMVTAVPANGKPTRMDVRSTLKLEGSDRLRVETTARTAAGEPRVAATVYKRVSATGTLAATPSIAKAKGTIAQVSWISGTWIGSSKTTTIEERWTPPAGGSMIGVSRTIRNDVLSAVEFLCIVERDGGLVYQAMPNGRFPPTDFTMTKLEPGSVLFENPAHDFPKMIRYTKRADGMLEAVVSGAAGAKPQTFLFKPGQ